MEATEAQTFADRPYHCMADDDLAIVRQPSCDHLFHAKCIIGWFNSTSLSHNKCPSCHKVLCQINVVTIGQTADHRLEAEVDDPLSTRAGWITLLNVIDNAFLAELRRPDGGADYAHIPRAVRDTFYRLVPNLIINSVHELAGPVLIEVIAARRERERVLEFHAWNTWSRTQFLGLWRAVERAYERSYPEPLIPAPLPVPESGLAPAPTPTPAPVPASAPSSQSPELDVEQPDEPDTESNVMTFILIDRNGNEVEMQFDRPDPDDEGDDISADEELLSFVTDGHPNDNPPSGTAADPDSMLLEQEQLLEDLQMYQKVLAS
jgi:hypothetical protein